VEKIIAGLIVVLGVLALIAGIGLLLAFPIKWTWNYTMPYLFGLKTIGWGQAWCLNFLMGCLVKAKYYSSNKD
jgi:hypothetical protein